MYRQVIRTYKVNKDFTISDDSFKVLPVFEFEKPRDMTFKSEYKSYTEYMEIDTFNIVTQVNAFIGYCELLKGIGSEEIQEVYSGD